MVEIFTQVVYVNAILRYLILFFLLHYIYLRIKVYIRIEFIAK